MKIFNQKLIAVSLTDLPINIYTHKHAENYLHIYIHTYQSMIHHGVYCHKLQVDVMFMAGIIGGVVMGP